MTSFLRWVVVAWLALTAPLVVADVPTVAVASSLQFAFPALIERFHATTGERVRVNYGASGTFRRQIAQQAPFELFLSADEASVLALHEAGVTQDAGVVYAIGHLVWLQPAGQGTLPPAEAPLAAVEQAIAAYQAGEGRPRVALANPEHAPYGVAARQVLEQAGLWEASAPLRVMGENVSQAARFALTDEARGGLVAYSLALAPILVDQAEHVRIPADWHAPLRQRMVLLPRAGDTARALHAWLQGEEARAILARFGFQAPDAAAAR